MNNLLDHALKYAALGWHVLPIVPRQKIPLTKHGVKDASVDSDQINDWWKKWPDANIAIACGEKSGVWVVDVDVEQATDVNGYDSLKEFPPLPETVKQNTPRGGFHAFYRTDSAPANRNGFRPGIDIRGDGYYVVVAPSLHPNGSHYNWDNNLAPWQIKPAEFPDFMRPTAKAPWQYGVPQGRPCLPTTSFAEIRPRASLYLAQCDPAIQGHGGHDKLLWAAVAMVHGFLLTDNQAIDLLLREYNPFCVPPWNMYDPKDAKDFRRKITEARKLTPKEGPGWLLNDPAYVPVDTANTISAEEVRALIQNSYTLQREAECRWLEGAGFEEAKPPFDKTCGIGYWLKGGREEAASSKELQYLTQPTGLVGEICAWLNTTALRQQPFLALACALTFCGVLFGRKVCDEMGSRTNLYCMGIARSSAGKTRILSQIRQLCLEVGCTDLLGGDDFASDSAIENRMAKKPATLFLCDEIGHLFSRVKSSMNQHTARIVPLLMKLYSAAGDVFLGREYADEEKQNTIIQPCCCIYGTSTPERFTNGITDDEMQDGWLSRCLVFHTKEKPPKTRSKHHPIPCNVVKQVRAWFLREIDRADKDDIATFVQGSAMSMTLAPPEQIIIPTDPKAEQIFIDFDNEATTIGEDQPQFDCLWGKAEENARKIGLILAAGDRFDSACITAANADYACRLIRYLLVDFCRTVAPAIVTNQIDAQKQRLLVIIASGGSEGLTTRKITRAARWSTKKQRADLLADLIEAEEVVAKTTSNSRGLRYWTMENFLRYQTQRESEHV